MRDKLIDILYDNYRLNKKQIERGIDDVIKEVLLLDIEGYKATQKTLKENEDLENLKKWVRRTFKLPVTLSYDNFNGKWNVLFDDDRGMNITPSICGLSFPALPDNINPNDYKFVLDKPVKSYKPVINKKDVNDD